MFDLVGQHILRGHYAEAVANCEHLLNYLPRHAPLRVDALAQLGVTWGILQDFSQSYKAFTEALALDPNTADLWYNRSEASRFMLRLGRALRDIERAIECVRAIQAYNLPLLSGFMIWLKQSGLSEETVYNHVVNSDFFSNCSGTLCGRLRKWKEGRDDIARHTKKLHWNCAELSYKGLLCRRLSRARAEKVRHC